MGDVNVNAYATNQRYSGSTIKMRKPLYRNQSQELTYFDNEDFDEEPTHIQTQRRNIIRKYSVTPGAAHLGLVVNRKS